MENHWVTRMNMYLAKLIRHTLIPHPYVSEIVKYTLPIWYTIVY